MKPILTEKSLKDAAHGKYAFWVPVNWTKDIVKNEISAAFKVHVRGVKTATKKASTHRSVQGKLQRTPAKKRAIVFLKDKEKIHLFDSESK